MPFGRTPPAKPEPEEPPADDDTEQRQVFWWRRRQALQVGMSPLEARLFAESDIGTDELRRLVRKGCPPELIGRVLL